MVRVLIVAKTKMKTGICLGGLVSGDYRNVRLLPSQGNNHPKGKRVNVGEIWDFALKEVPASEIKPPHTEDMRVIRERYIRSVPVPKLKEFLLKYVEASFVHPNALFDGLIRFTHRQRGYVSPADGIPQYSTGFWRFEKALHKDQDNAKPRYIYFDDGVNWTLDVPYVGFQKPLETILPGALLRFSLARGFPDDPQKRCYLQLSDWFL